MTSDKKKIDDIVSMDRSYFPGTLKKPPNERPQCSGILAHERRYFVYRFGIYKDEFNAYTG